MKPSPVLSGLRTYPFVRLTDAKRELLAARGRGRRLRHRRAARGHAAVHPRGAGRRAAAAVDLPAGRGPAGAARPRSPRGSSGASAPALDPGTEVLPTLGSKEAIFHLAQVVGGDFVAVTTPGYPVAERGAAFAGKQVLELPLLAERGLPPRPRRGRLVARRDPVAQLPEQPDRRDRAARAATSAPRRSRASTTSWSPPTRPTRRSTSARSRRPRRSRSPTAAT